MTGRRTIVLSLLVLIIVLVFELLDPPLTFKVGDFPIIEGPVPSSGFLQMATGGSVTTTIQHNPEALGHYIKITISTSGGRTISSVIVKVDGRTEKHQKFGPAVESYVLELRQVSGYSPGLDHDVVVEVRSNGATSRHVTNWTD